MKRWKDYWEVYIAMVILLLITWFIGYFMGSVTTKIKVGNIHPENIAPLIAEEEVSMVDPISNEDIFRMVMNTTAELPTPKEIIEVSALEGKDLYISYAHDIVKAYDFIPNLSELVVSMMEVESNFNPSLTSSAGCIGLMQVSPYWQTERAESLGVYDLWDPYGNILVAVDFLEDLYYNYTNEDIVLAVMMYNMDFSQARSMYSNGQWSPYAIKVFSIFDSLKG